MGSEPSLSIEERKVLAEIAKLEAETRVIGEELGRPWFRKRYFFQAITAGLVALPLVWFYFEKVALPLNRSENIEQELSNAEEQKRLANRNDQLEREARNLANVKKNLERDRAALIAGQKELVAQVREHKEAVAALQVQLASVERQSREDRAKLVNLQQSLRASSTQASQLEEDIEGSLALNALLDLVPLDLLPEGKDMMNVTFHELRERLSPAELSQIDALMRSFLEREAGRKLPADLLENHRDLTIEQLWHLVRSESRPVK